MSESRPAWSRESVMLRLPTIADIETFSPAWAFGTSTGRGVRVAVIDSGIDADHPDLDRSVDVEGGVEFTVDELGAVHRVDGPHGDVYGHGTACAGIIHALAPDAMITSVRVLDDGLRGRAAAFHAGLSWAVEAEFDVINLSLGAAKRDWALAFHDTCDRGYFNNSFIVTAANNIQRDSFPSLFASVASVASNNSSDPLRFHINPEPPTEFLARGIDVEVPWLDGTRITTTGNSFAAPHIAGFAALIKAEHPDLRPFQVKTALWAASANVREAIEAERAARPAAGRPTTTQALHGPRGAVPDELDRIAPADRVDGPAPGPPVDPDEERAEIQRLLVGYEVGELIARGPWGPVYSATRDGGALALRRLDPSLASDPGTRARFAASVRIAAELRHPNIVPIIELRETDFFAVISMPLCPGNLGETRAAGPLDPLAVAAAAISLLRGLHVAHAAGIYHGDLRPENALIDEDGRVLVSDVGIAAALTSDVRTNSAPDDPMSYSYLAPEQLAGAAIGAFTDIHAVGVLLFELLSGRLPRHSGADPTDGPPGDADPIPLLQVAPAVPPGLAGLVDVALAPDPTERHRSAEVFARAIDDWARAIGGPDWIDRQPYLLDPPANDG